MDRRAAAGRWLLLAALAAAGCGEAHPPQQPHSVLLVTLDTTRADRIGAYGHARAHTPQLDALARQGILFERAYAATPITLPSHASILTGVYPAAHGVRDNGHFRLRDEATLISEVLRERGWRTGAFTAAYVLDAKFGLDQGFEIYSSTRRGFDVNDARPADQVVSDAIRWLETLAPHDRYFAWLHFFDPHAPYNTHGVETDSREVAYDAEIAFCDLQLGRLLDFLETAGLADNLLIAVTGDHGEAFGAHGESTHGVLLYEPTLHVPLLLAGSPVAHQAGTRVSHPVSHVQLAPTLLDLIGLPRETLPESSLPSLLEGTPPPDVLLETLVPFYTYGWRGLLGLVAGSHKLIRGTEPEIYALDEDAGEESDLSERHPDLRQQLQGRLDAALATAPPLGWSEALIPDLSDEALLAELGYVARPLGAGDPFDATLADPRRRIGNVDRYQKALEKFLQHSRLSSQPTPPTAWQRDERQQQGRLALLEAQALLQQVLEKDPYIIDAQRLIGSVERELGNLESSIEWLERVAARRPDMALAHYELALSYRQAGRAEEARDRLVQALRLAPRHPEFYKTLATWALEEEAYGRAVGWLESWARVAAPGSPEAQHVRAALAAAEKDMRARGQKPVSPPEIPID